MYIPLLLPQITLSLGMYIYIYMRPRCSQKDVLSWISFGSCTDEWSAPLGKDAARPAPLGGHCFTKFDTHRALLFGGRYEGGRVNDTWIFDLEERVCTSVLCVIC